MMQWEKLLSLKKFGDTKTRLRSNEDPTRVGFEVDYDRIIFSPAFRSLQDKTQVIPLSKTDFVHTRLTHSLEVSVVGRSLGRKAGKFILEKYPNLKELGYTINDFGAIVAAASLAHDIGNPPFGHSGERAIGEFFKNGSGNQYQSALTDKQWQDLIDFEGNANGFSVLASSMFGNKGGMRLTFATLGTFMKYPKESLPKKPTKNIADKKYGFFQSDKDFFIELANELGLISNKPDGFIGFERHPLTYLVEAADDICYTIIDFEDGINLGWIDEDLAFTFLQDLVKEKIKFEHYQNLATKEERISYLRAIAIGNLIEDAVTLFTTYEPLILKGEFQQALMSKSNFKTQIDNIIKISVEKIYRSSEVTKKEITGYKVINTLLEAFCTAYNNKFEGKATGYDELVLRLLPSKFQQTENECLYSRLMHICHFVSLLTDGNALKLYETIQKN